MHQHPYKIQESQVVAYPLYHSTSPWRIYFKNWKSPHEKISSTHKELPKCWFTKVFKFDVEDQWVHILTYFIPDVKLVQTKLYSRKWFWGSQTLFIIAGRILWWNKFGEYKVKQKSLRLRYCIISKTHAIFAEHLYSARCCFRYRENTGSKVNTADKIPVLLSWYSLSQWGYQKITK